MDLPSIDAELHAAVRGIRRFPWSYDVQTYTGYPIALDPQGRWAHGAIARGNASAVFLPPVQPMPVPGGDASEAIRARR